MLFIGHFSFDEIDNDDRQRHGYLTCLVDAENPDDAVSQFEGHIKKMKTSAKEMVNIVNVYIEEILRFEQVPTRPIITRMQFSAGAFPASVSHSLPGVFGEGVDTFGFAPDVENHEMLNDGGYIESKPFIAFDQ